MHERALSNKMNNDMADGHIITEYIFSIAQRHDSKECK